MQVQNVSSPFHSLICGLVHISEKIIPEVTAWQNRPLETVYPFVFLDAIHYKVKENHQYQTKAAYVVLGVTMDGTKDILGVWIGEHESSKFWMQENCRALDRQMSNLGRGFVPAPAHVPGPPDCLNPASP